jgi:hypothetical protein
LLPNQSIFPGQVSQLILATALNGLSDDICSSRLE